jgi:hypothetical protein
VNFEFQELPWWYSRILKSAWIAIAPRNEKRSSIKLFRILFISQQRPVTTLAVAESEQDFPTIPRSQFL